MRKIISILIIFAFVFSGIAQAGIPTLSETGEIRGQGKYPFEPHRTFRLVRYSPLASGVTSGKYMNSITPDHLVIWATGAKTGDGVTITDSYISRDNRIAGVIISTILTPEPGNYQNSATQDVGERNWGWLQTFGLARISAGGYVSAGDALVTYAKRGVGWTAVPSDFDERRVTNGGFWMETTPDLAVAQKYVRCFLRCGG